MRRPIDPNPAEVELLLAAERQLVLERDELAERAVERARAAIPRRPGARLSGRASALRPSRIGLSVAAAVLLFAVCAAAFLAGYRIKTEEGSASSPRPALARFASSPAVPVPPSARPNESGPEPLLPAARVARVAPSLRHKSAASSEVDVTELEVLRPAQQALVTGDFASALATIADHRRRFPSGQLAEEREALRVKALLGLGHRAEAERVGTAFRARFPQSALLERIDEMLEARR